MTAAAITVIERATVARINEEHHACQRAYGDALAHAIEAGRLLAEVKGQLRHGEFMPWIEEHFEGSQRTANVYMQLAAAPQVAEDSQATASFTTIEGALKQVAKPKRVTASDAGALLQGLGGDQSWSKPGADVVGDIQRAADRIRSQARADAWTEQERRKLARATGMLDDALDKLQNDLGPGLSRYAISEILRDSINETRKALPMLEELAFSFER